MNAGKTVFAQFLGFVPFHHFEHLVDKLGSNRWAHSFTAWSHFICMAYAQLTIAQIYKQRWQVELFFKWLKQHLSIDHFFGNSANAVKSQVWIPIEQMVRIAMRAEPALPMSYQQELFG